MLIPRAQRDAAFAAAREAVDTIRLGDPLDPASTTVDTMLARPFSAT
jgi:aldehyde dehydrogenase (NAD+)